MYGAYRKVIKSITVHKMVRKEKPLHFQWQEAKGKKKKKKKKIVVKNGNFSSTTDDMHYYTFKFIRVYILHSHSKLQELQE